MLIMLQLAPLSATYLTASVYNITVWAAMADGKITRRMSYHNRVLTLVTLLKATIYRTIIVTHLKLCLAGAIHNFKW